MNMSLFKKFFGSKLSPVRQYLNSKTQRVNAIDEIDDSNVGLSIIWGIVMFGMESDKRPIKELCKFTSDSSLFELACYIQAFVKNRSKDLENKLSEKVEEEIGCGFSALVPNAVILNNLINDRVDCYEALWGGQMVEMELLKFLLVSSRTGSPVHSCDQKFSELSVDFFGWTLSPEFVSLRRTVGFWSEVFVNQYVDNILLSFSKPNAKRIGLEFHKKFADPVAEEYVRALKRLADNYLQNKVVLEITNKSELTKEEVVAKFHALNMALFHVATVTMDEGNDSRYVDSMLAIELTLRRSLIDRFPDESIDSEEDSFTEIFYSEKNLESFKYKAANEFVMQIESFDVNHQMISELWLVIGRMFDLHCDILRKLKADARPIQKRIL